VSKLLVVATTGAVAKMADMFVRLKDRGIEPTGFSTRLPTLDDVFLQGPRRRQGGLSCELSLTPGP
jgi:hypothetical protein